MANDVRFLIEYTLPHDLAVILSENLIACDPDPDDSRHGRLIGREIEARLVDPSQPPINLQDYTDALWALERVLEHMAASERREILFLFRAIAGARGESIPVLDRLLAEEDATSQQPGAGSNSP
jgi:hypothetical protein